MQVLQLQTLLQIYGQQYMRTSCPLQQMWPFVDVRSEYVQASDFMNDEEGVQELCRQGAHWIFGSRGSVSKPELAHDRQAALQKFGALSEDRVQVRCFCASKTCSATPYCQLSVHVYALQRIGGHPQTANVDLMFMRMGCLGTW